MTAMSAPRLLLDVGCVSSAPEHVAVPPFAPALVPASAPGAVHRVMILALLVLTRRWPVYFLPYTRCVHVAADLHARSAW